jgi:hypothetical protein
MKKKERFRLEYPKKRANGFDGIGRPVRLRLMAEKGRQGHFNYLR